jgi:hypothetical protein
MVGTRPSRLRRAARYCRAALLAILAGIVTCAHGAPVVWEPVGGLYGGGVEELIALPGGGLLARTAMGVRRSTRRGDTWVAAPTETRGWVELRGTIYGASPGGVHSSPDGGRTWRRTGLDVPTTGLAASGSAVYALTAARVLRFDDGEWQDIGDATFLGGPPSAVAAVGEHVFAARVVDGYIEGEASVVWRFTAQTDAWEPVLSHSDAFNWVFALVSVEGRLYVGGRDAVLWSDDLGETWERGEMSLATGFAADEGFLYVPFEMGFARSDDGGTTWGGVATRWPWEPFTSSRGATFRNVLAAADGHVYAATARSGLYRARHGQTDWDLVGVAEHPAPWRMAAAGGHVVAATGGEAFVTSDADNVWRRSPLSATYSGGIVSDGRSVYVGTHFEGLRGSSDGGRTWTGSDFAGASVLATCAFDGVVYAAAAPLAFTAAPAKAAAYGLRIVGSDDGGQNWLDLTDDIAETFYHVQELAGAAGALYAKVEGYESPDRRVEWLRRRGGVWSPAPAVPGEGLLGVGGSLYAAAANGIWRSRDGGDTWQPFADGISGVRPSSIVALNGALYVGSRAGIYMSPDDGRHWRAVDGGLHGGHVVSLAASEAFMYASVAGLGVVRAPIDSVIADVDANGRLGVPWALLKRPDAPAAGLLPGYPNPFNPDTWIPYDLAEAAAVTIIIRDIGGSTVRRIDVGFQGAGAHRTRARAAHWDGRNDAGEPVSSGVYFVTLTAGATTSRRRVTLAR